MSNYRCRFYYGMNHKNPIAKAGQLAIETWNKGERSKDLEVSVGVERKDIGRIEVLEEGVSGWNTVYREPEGRK